MEKVNVKYITEQKFNAYVGITRSPILFAIAKEISWYSNTDETVIGTILFDFSDEDYNPLILGRDEVGRFRAIDLSTSYPKFEDAENWLVNTIKWLSGLDKRVFPQGDPIEKMELFKELVPRDQQHPYFTALNTQKSLLAAKMMIQEIMPHFIDIDGNFIRQFQTTEFDQRLWELYLFCYFNEEGLSIDRTNNAPDFLLTNHVNSVAVEATIVGRKNTASYYRFADKPFISEIPDIELKNNMPLRFGSPLYSKLKHTNKENKHYWEYDHVKGKPFVIAIHDFHDDFSMIWSHTSLLTYLYGYEHNYEYVNGQLVIKPNKVDTLYKADGTPIPSGFFFQPLTENISAILNTSIGTISKFNRLGKQAGFGDKSVLMIRYGTCHNHDPNASKPNMFRYEVNEDSQETWGEGVSIYHNPNALIPLEKELFPNAAHHSFENGQIVSLLPDFFPYNSMTHNLQIREDG
jgi:hypothetical protein